MRGPHLVLADSRGEDRVRRGKLTDALDDLLRGEAVVGRAVVGDRVGRAPAVQLLPPGGVAGLRTGVGLAFREQRADGAGQIVDGGAGVADDGHIDTAILADLGGVDVDVHDLGVRGERVHPAGDPVVEACSQGHDQVGFLQCGDGRDRSVHAGHSHVLAVTAGERAQRHQCGGDGGTGQLGEFPQFGGGAGLEDAATDVQHRTLGPGDQPRCFPDLLPVGTRHRRGVGGERC